MTTTMLISTIIECAVGLFICWGVFNEEKLCDFEEAAWDIIKSRFVRRKEDERVGGALSKEV